GKARIWFVMEGEASLRACVLNDLANDILSDECSSLQMRVEGRLIMSSYAIRGTDPLLVEKVAPPDC
ncbi:hypothetical protein JOM56_005018, partial [Amanita muscaria]